MLRVAVVGGDATSAPLLVADDYPSTERVKVELPAEHGEQFHRRLVGALCHSLGVGLVGTSEGGPSGVLDAGRFAHLHPDVGVVAACPAMPAPVVPGEALVDGAIVPVNEAVNAGPVIAGLVPVLDEHLCVWLWTAHRVEHQPLDRDFPPRLVAGILGQNRFHQFHLLVLLPGLLRPVVKLGEDVLQCFGDRQAQVGGVLQQGQPLIREIEEDHRRAHDAPGSNHIHIQDVGDAHQQENQHLPTDALETNGAGELLVRRRAHDPRDVVNDCEGHQREEQAVTAAQEPAQPAADGGEGELDAAPELFHFKHVLSENVYHKRPSAERRTAFHTNWGYVVGSFALM